MCHIDSVKVKTPGFPQVAGDSFHLGIKQGQIGLQQRSQCRPFLNLFNKRPDLCQQFILVGITYPPFIQFKSV